MAIKTGLSNDVVAVLAADTVIYTVSTDTRAKVEAFNAHATAAATVTFYISPDDTSASGDVVGSYTFALGEDLDINALVGQGYDAGKRIIAVADVTGVNASLTYTLWTGDQV